MIVQPHRIVLPNPLTLDGGQTLNQVEVVFEKYGELNADHSNAILVCHGLTANHHAAGCHTPDQRRVGWWDQAIGPGKALDTRSWCVIAPSALGSSAGTGPTAINPETGRPYGLRFPVVTIGDMVKAQAALLDVLDIPRLYAAVGGCLGGFQV